MGKNICGFDVAFLKQIKNLMKETEIQEIEMEEGENLYIRITKRKHNSMGNPAILSNTPVINSVVPVPRPITEEKEIVNQKESEKKSSYDDESKYFKIKSPVIGTFYEAPSPNSLPYVKLGDKVSADTTVCIVEAMKIMNEIKAEVNGKIIEILKTNASPVQAGEVLFIVEKM